MLSAEQQRRMRAEAKIAAGFPEGDRYVLAACETNQLAVDLARRLETRGDAERYYHPPDWVVHLLKARVADLLHDIPVMLIPCRGEPYLTSEDMQRDVRDNQQMYVRVRKQGPVVGAMTQSWRAVHDYYGHVLCHAPFTLSGELRAYIKHTAQFPRACLPFLWNNVVLENAYRLNRGEFYCKNFQCSSIIVFDDEEFGPEDAFHNKFTQGG